MRIQSCPQRLPSQTVSERIEELVQSRTAGMIKDLRVEVEQEVVVSGRTTSYYNKQLATHAVLDALGSVSLRNEIEVR